MARVVAIIAPFESDSLSALLHHIPLWLLEMHSIPPSKNNIGTYTVEIDVMHSFLKFSRKLFRLSTGLTVFNGFHFAKLDNLHHPQEITNLGDMSFNAKAAVKDKRCILAYLASDPNDSAFSHFEPPVGNKRSRDLTARSDGDQNAPCIVPLTRKDVFSSIQDSPGREFLLRVSYREIYNEVITDLLNPTGQNLRVREEAQAGSESSKTETTGLRRKEGSYINKSLLMLNVIPGYLGDAPAHHCHSAGNDDKSDDFRDNSLLRELENKKESPCSTVVDASGDWRLAENEDLQGKIQALEQQHSSPNGVKPSLSAEKCITEEHIEDLKTKVGSQEAENKKLKLQHVQLLEDNSGLRKQSQK
ncbi:hypothetical protein Nepgr_012545 [Nepenthes gracilis]|uniref:Kinesin motor domain-containing protein n=1 Tax=Nepenthes gracilis TaxID=150966 RepID=A0AAD3SHE6_NEPGR|nr:hypothetical protein Nepgr_012545 [Nepenthes gracilis]